MRAKITILLNPRKARKESEWTVINGVWAWGRIHPVLLRCHRFTCLFNCLFVFLSKLNECFSHGFTHKKWWIKSKVWITVSSRSVREQSVQIKLYIIRSHACCLSWHKSTCIYNHLICLQETTATDVQYKATWCSFPEFFNESLTHFMFFSPLSYHRLICLTSKCMHTSLPSLHPPP